MKDIFVVITHAHVALHAQPVLHRPNGNKVNSFNERSQLHE